MESKNIPYGRVLLNSQLLDNQLGIIRKNDGPLRKKEMER